MGCGPAQTRVDPDASYKRYLLGADYFNKGFVQPALEELLKAVELNPDNADAHNLLGLVFLRKGAEAEELSTRNQCLKGEELRLEKQEMDRQFKKAQEQFEKAVSLKSDFSEARNNLAVVMIHFGRYDDAVELSEKALSNIIYREPYAANGNLGQAYLEKRDFARAAKALRQAIFEQPKFCVGRYRLAKVYYETKDWDRAAEEISEVVGDKSCPIQEAYHLAGLVSLRRDNRDKAHEFFARCVELAPKSCLASECKLAQ
ncbi:MAG: repeat-containing protein [Myxococcales bacterium]|nr:repeat-containing protein [Myxococcales bacterium]